MDVYLIRHAEAAPLGEGGTTSDSERPLTDLGHEQARRVAVGLQAHGVRLGIVLTSPLLRARQTAEEMLQHWTAPAPELRVCDELAPGGKRKKLARVLEQAGTDSVALIGHQPDLNLFCGWLLGDRKLDIELAKAGVACLRSDGKTGKQSAALQWLVPPEWFGG
jgi:phosphohistidine phosphatase